MVRLDQADSRARDRATTMLAELSDFWQEALRPQLAQEGIIVLEPNEYTRFHSSRIAARTSRLSSSTKGGRSSPA